MSGTREPSTRRASSICRSPVTPGSRGQPPGTRRVRRLKSVGLPTFGRPTIATRPSGLPGSVSTWAGSPLAAAPRRGAASAPRAARRRGVDPQARGAADVGPGCAAEASRSPWHNLADPSKVISWAQAVDAGRRCQASGWYVDRQAATTGASSCSARPSPGAGSTPHQELAAAPVRALERRGPAPCPSVTTAGASAPPTVGLSLPPRTRACPAKARIGWPSPGSHGPPVFAHVVDHTRTDDAERQNIKPVDLVEHEHPRRPWRGPLAVGTTRAEQK